MTEHTNSDAVEVKTLDWLAVRHYLYRNPDGAFYAVTDQQKVLQINLYTMPGRLLWLKAFGAGHSVGFTMRTVTTAHPNRIPGFGVVRVILFVSREANDLEDLASIAGPLYKVAMRDPREAEGNVKAKFVVLDALTPSTLDDQMTSYYLLVQKPAPVYPSVFWAHGVSDLGLRIYLKKYDAATGLGRPMLSPVEFNYQPGGEFVIRYDTRGSKERSIGQVLAIVGMLEHMAFRDVYATLLDAQRAQK